MGMTIYQAVQKVAAAETITGFTAQSVVKDNKKMGDFCTMIYEQYHRDGNKDNLIELYGQEVIETIINYGEATNLIDKK